MCIRDSLKTCRRTTPDPAHLHRRESHVMSHTAPGARMVVDAEVDAVLSEAEVATAGLITVHTTAAFTMVPTHAAIPPSPST